VQKFTRPITREVELAGERLALTLTEEGIAVRLVGKRAEPRRLSWAAVVAALTGEVKEPAAEEVAAAVAAIKKPPAAKKTAKPAAAADEAKGDGKQPAEETPHPDKAPAADHVRELLERLEGWLAKHRRRFLEGLRPGANEAELHQMEAQLGVPVPAALRTLLAWHNGQGDDFIGRFDGEWLLLGTERIVAAKKELDAGAGGDGEGSGWQPAWIPFMDDDAGNYRCLDTSQAGAPVREFWSMEKEHPVVAKSLEAWLEDFVTAVEQGEYHEEPERGVFLRRRHARE
jgi:cell wall assembly regulator SMI1